MGNLRPSKNEEPSKAPIAEAHVHGATIQSCEASVRRAHRRGVICPRHRQFRTISCDRHIPFRPARTRLISCRVVLNRVLRSQHGAINTAAVWKETPNWPHKEHVTINYAHIAEFAAVPLQVLGGPEWK